MFASGGAESDVELRAEEGESGKSDHRFVRQSPELGEEHEQEHEHDEIGDEACSKENSVRSPGGQEGSVEEDDGQEAVSLSRERSPPGLPRLTRHRDGEMKTRARSTIGSRSRSTVECGVEAGIGRIAGMHESVDADVGIGSGAEFGTEPGRIFGNDAAGIGSDVEVGSEPEIAGREVEGRGKPSAAERRTGGAGVGVSKGDDGIEWCYVDSEAKE